MDPAARATRGLMSVARAITVVLTLLAFTSCTLLRPLEVPSSDAIRSEVQVGDFVVIEGTNGQIYELSVLRLDQDYLLGISDARKQYKLSYAAIKTIRVRQVSAGRTAGVIALSVLAVLAIAYACIWGCSVKAGD